MMIEKKINDKTWEELMRELIDTSYSLLKVKNDDESIIPSSFFKKVFYYQELYKIVDELHKKESIIPIPDWIEKEMEYQEKIKKAKAYEVCYSKNRDYELYQTIVNRKYVHIRKEIGGKETVHSIPKEEFLKVIESLHLYDWKGDFYNPVVKDEELWFVNISYSKENNERLYGLNSFPSGFSYLINCLRDWTKEEKM